VPYYLGIDGGGSKTACAVGDADSRLATASAGPCNITRVGEARARESLHHAIRAACAAAGIVPGQIQRACAGIAGAGREAAAGIVRKIIAEIVPGEVEVVGDMPVALEAAFGTRPGVVVIAGTGSIAYGRDAQGRTARAGGWGFAISDEGSAHWIGRTAVSALLRALDEQGEDEQIEVEADALHAARSLPLLRELTAVWKLHSLDELIRTANSNPDFAALFPAIMAAADAGDDLARRVLTQAGEELAQLAGIVVRRLFGEDNAQMSSIALAMAGGVFCHSSLVREVFCDEVRKFASPVVPNSQIVEPVLGALQMARRRGKAE
jgi:N-acetylglucosamine kinase-like BadF-type ATPase